LDLVEAIHKIQSHNLFISAGMIVGFDNDDPSIFEEQYQFLQKAQIPFVMLSLLLAVPKTPLYQRLEAAGRLVPIDAAGDDRARYLGTAGGTNFHPLHMTREVLKRGQMALYQRLYEPEAFRARLLGNLSRFQNVRFRPEPPNRRGFGVLWRPVRPHWKQSSGSWRFFWNCLGKATMRSPRLIAQMAVYMGMHMHFCKVHGDELSWNPWQPKPRGPAEPLDPTRVLVGTEVAAH